MKCYAQAASFYIDSQSGCTTKISLNSSGGRGGKAARQRAVAGHGLDLNTGRLGGSSDCNGGWGRAMLEFFLRYGTICRRYERIARLCERGQGMDPRVYEQK